MGSQYTWHFKYQVLIYLNERKEIEVKLEELLTSLRKIFLYYSNIEHKISHYC